jgi:hypothetical protein
MGHSFESGSQRFGCMAALSCDRRKFFETYFSHCRLPRSAALACLFATAAG